MDDILDEFEVVEFKYRKSGKLKVSNAPISKVNYYPELDKLTIISDSLCKVITKSTLEEVSTIYVHSKNLTADCFYPDSQSKIYLGSDSGGMY